MKQIPQRFVVHVLIIFGVLRKPYAVNVAIRLIQSPALYAPNIIISSQRTPKSVANVRVLQIQMIVKLYVLSITSTKRWLFVQYAPPIWIKQHVAYAQILYSHKYKNHVLFVPMH